eukprot:scaffold15131_cov88-Isochrysis_galbana.AAC.2
MSSRAAARPQPAACSNAPVPRSASFRSCSPLSVLAPSATAAPSLAARAAPARPQSSRCQAPT